MGPIVVGGLGGSGTRTIAAILESLGVFLGSDLNEAKDDLTFTLLFKPLYRRTSTLAQAVTLARPRLRLYTRLADRQPLTPGERLRLADATAAVWLRGHDHMRTGRGRWALARRKAALSSSRPDRRRFDAWGWKEPNSHIFLPALLDHHPDLRYVHLVRHGLDMAFSSNDTQLHIWGRHFGVPVPQEEPLPVSRLRYWWAANGRVAELSQRHPERCHIMRFEDVCQDPREACRALASFCARPYHDEALERSAELVRPPQSLGRFAEHDLGPFSEEDLARLETFGYRAADRHR